MRRIGHPKDEGTEVGPGSNDRSVKSTDIEKKKIKTGHVSHERRDG